ncbi:nitroreductase [Variovorax arabinosiphilus]|uniref:nitroreductase n=1 Tax=Variovorax arabinosiphilus TaxID=3053498 RepID=UPI002574DBA1|nr:MULTISPECIES: nitroreductase [unclassified Variovorax]MDM0123331.1 nitroreductase [Variovorax sp. J2L1-78]MDM0131673.1 nitroreductase [Variovorax sp. J2L1-63]MDM0236094.1 nitroreductase [Variovorax sp. J2R1-6]
MNRMSDAPIGNDQDLQRAVDWAITTRRSVRAFQTKDVTDAQISDILQVASYAASGMNTQPWHVHVVRGESKERLSQRITEIDADPAQTAELREPYDYYPVTWTSPFVERRRKVGWDLYGLLGIEKGDKQRMHAQHGRNYRFFDAPIGLFFTVSRAMEQGSLIDYGMFLQSVMVAARARGLDTCPQVAFTKFHRVIAEELGIPDDQMLVCGMSLGYADMSRAENTLATEREPVASFTTFHQNQRVEQR